MDKISKYCEGCMSQIHGHGYCKLMNSNKKGECPCASCLIKVICLTGCQNFFTFRVDHRI